jgi:hypothetical protein
MRTIETTVFRKTIVVESAQVRMAGAVGPGVARITQVAVSFLFWRRAAKRR